MYSIIAKNVKVYEYLSSAIRLTSLNYGVISVLILASSTTFCILYREFMQPVYLGLLLVYVISFNELMIAQSKLSMGFSRHMISVKRCHNIHE